MFFHTLIATSLYIIGTLDLSLYEVYNITNKTLWYWIVELLSVGTKPPSPIPYMNYTKYVVVVMLSVESLLHGKFLWKMKSWIETSYAIFSLIVPYT